MRILLVTTTNLLPFTLSKVLNPSLEYCAIVVDEPDIAKKFLTNVPPFRNIVHPFYELEEVAEKYYYDLVFCVAEDFHDVINGVSGIGISREKIISLADVTTLENFFTRQSFTLLCRTSERI